MKGVLTKFQSITRLMRFAAGRNQIGLTERQIAYCLEVWAALCADQPIALNTSEAVQYASRTRFNETQNIVLLGADALPGDGVDANARLSTLACLAHEFREDLVEDARDRLIQWLSLHQQEGETDAQSGTERGDPARGL